MILEGGNKGCDKGGRATYRGRRNRVDPVVRISLDRGSDPAVAPPKRLPAPIEAYGRGTFGVFLIVVG